jgi:hypothetical protein
VDHPQCAPLPRGAPSGRARPLLLPQYRRDALTGDESIAAQTVAAMCGAVGMV